MSTGSEVSASRQSSMTLVTVPTAADPNPRTRVRTHVHALVRSPPFCVGAGVLLFWVVAALAWRHIVPHNPQAVDLGQVLHSPSAAHWFGTDNLGRDVLSRVVAGAAPVLSIAPAATAVAVAGGTMLGLVSASSGRLVDELLMRIIEAVMAFPWLVVAIGILALTGRSLITVFLVIGALFVPPVSRTVRAAVLSERNLEYVEAAVVRGEPRAFILTREILPNIAGVILVEATVRLGLAVFASATLSFLSLGLQPPSPDWGLTIAQGRVYLQSAPWVVLFPAAALASLVVAVNLTTGALRERLTQ
jgi:peptide/nickel transport system permease protein